MNESRDWLYNFIENTIKNIHYSLEKMKEQMPKLIVRSGFIKIANGKLGYVSCFPHGCPSEESLDGTIEISETDDHFIVLTGVHWSNGEIVADIGEIKINADNKEMQLLQLKSLEIDITHALVNTLLQSTID